MPRVPPACLAVVVAALLAPTVRAQDVPPAAVPTTPAVEATAQNPGAGASTDTGKPYTNEAGAKNDAGKPFYGWDDGFYLRSADNRFSLRVTGQLQADFRAYLNPNDRTDLDQFLLRRARFGLEATMFKYYEFRFLPDFGNGQTRIQDGYMNVHYWDEFQVSAGKFKQPFSYEQLIQDRYTPLMERSLIDQLVPARDIGLMVHGQKLLGDRLDYALAISNGELNGDADTNNSKDFNTRVAARPFAGLEDSVLRRFQVGVSGGWGLEHETPPVPNGLRTPANVQFFQFASGVVADGTRWRLSPEVAYFLGPFGMSAQYFRMEQKFRSAAAAPVVNVPFDGFYAQATYLLTGEERTGYSQQIAPKHPFDPVGGISGIGAWELVGRVSRIHAADRVFAAGDARLADPALFSNGATEMTLGCSWYLNRWARVQFNWEHAWFDRKVRLGTGDAGLLKSQDTLMTRLQFVF